MVKVKICGITNSEDAFNAVDAGCDALGFVFYKKSPRYIAPLTARKIIARLPKRIIKIGVFVNAREKTIRHIAKICRLDMLQFHGAESPEFCAKFKGYKIIKAFRIKNCLNEKELLRYKPFACLFDTYVREKAGGTGKKFDWKLIRHVNKLKQPVFLSGGLNAGNVTEAIRFVNPEWVDASSSLEELPGKKDRKRMNAFVSNAKNALKKGFKNVTR